MAILPVVGRKSPRVALVIAMIYAALIVLGATMVVPFLITVSSSASNAYDYNRFDVIPHYLWSRDDRFVKGLVLYFSEFKKADEQMRAYFHDMPDYWSTWQVIGKDEENVARVAAMGPNLIVTGSAVFDGKTPAENARYMLDQVRSIAAATT